MSGIDKKSLVIVFGGLAAAWIFVLSGAGQWVQGQWQGLPSVAPTQDTVAAEISSRPLRKPSRNRVNELLTGEWDLEDEPQREEDTSQSRRPKGPPGGTARSKDYDQVTVDPHLIKIGILWARQEGKCERGQKKACHSLRVRNRDGYRQLVELRRKLLGGCDGRQWQACAALGDLEGAAGRRQDASLFYKKAKACLTAKRTQCTRRNPTPACQAVFSDLATISKKHSELAVLPAH